MIGSLVYWIIVITRIGKYGAQAFVYEVQAAQPGYDVEQAWKDANLHCTGEQSPYFMRNAERSDIRKFYSEREAIATAVELNREFYLFE